MTPYVFFLDIDDTILHKKSKTDPGTISPRVIQAMRTAREMGHKVLINTGRAPSYFTDAIRNLPVDGYACGCGAYILLGKEVIYQAEYPNEIIASWMERLSKPGDPGIVIEGIRKIFRYRNSYWMPEKDWILSNSVEDFRKYLKNDAVVKANICNDIDTAILPELEKDFWVIHHPSEHYTECCVKGCSKAEAMRIVMDSYGLDLSRSVAIGDSENDLDMIRTAGIGIAMGQSKEYIKRAADTVTDSIVREGAAKAIEKIIGSK